MKRLRYIGKTVKQDEQTKRIVQSSLQNRVKRNVTMKHTSFLFL